MARSELDLRVHTIRRCSLGVAASTRSRSYANLVIACTRSYHDAVLVHFGTNLLWRLCRWPPILLQHTWHPRVATQAEHAYHCDSL